MKLKLKPKEQLLVFVVGCLVLIYLFNASLLSPSLAKYRGLKSEIKEKEQSLRSLNQKLNMLQGIEKASPAKREAIKSQEEIAVEVISYLSKNISRLKINLISLKPEYREVSAKEAKSMFFDLMMEGDYNQIYRMISALDDCPTLIKVDKFKLARKSSDLLSVSMQLGAYY